MAPLAIRSPAQPKTEKDHEGDAASEQLPATSGLALRAGPTDYATHTAFSAGVRIQKVLDEGCLITVSPSLY